MVDDRRDPLRWTTVLFVPGDQPEMLAKAASRGADTIVIDLEDGVAAGSKAAARESAREYLENRTDDAPGAVGVRINVLDDGGSADLEALRSVSVDAVMLPKVERLGSLLHGRQLLDESLPDGKDVPLIAQIESALGIVRLAELAATTGLGGLALGGEDLCVDMGVVRSETSVELLFPRAMVALHARSIGVAAFDTVYTSIADEMGLMRESHIARQLGFSGKMVIHPAQVNVVRTIFAPSSEEIEWARRIVAGVEARETSGPGVVLVDGVMADAPVVAQARRILAQEA